MAGGILLGTVTIGSLIILYALMKLMKRPKISLQNKVVLITGASSGVGEACAKVFYMAGARVILCARRENELERVKNDLMKLKTDNVHVTEPVVLRLNLEEYTTMSTWIKQAVAIHGKIDILINNGGISYRGEVLQTDVETDVKIMTVNYFGQVALTKAVLPYMKNSGWGHIVAVSSVQGKIAIPFRSAYAASKHALQAFCDSVRSEMEEYNIGVSVISPGYIQTNLSVNALTGTGSVYGVMDETTASGMLASDVAKQIAHAVIHHSSEVVLAPIAHCFTIYFRNIMPSLYFYIMNRRAKKQRLASNKVK